MSGKSLSDSHSFLALAKKRKTTYEFTPEKVKDSFINKILEAGRWAPSCSNTQPWHFVVIRDKNVIQKLMMTANYGDFHTDPPVLLALVLLKDRCPGKGLSCFRGKDSGVYDSYISVGMAALNMTLQAAELSVDSCIITPSQKEARKILKVRTSDAVPLLVGLGFQSPKTLQKARIRRPLSEIVSQEMFGGNR
ncbi:hypothetical protein COV20_00815 [Candidatus Woesearchaeota archaeon CG10_big_fil_rev_8_21_14_0_10_45_16]|nr:MAG: hypothetical protein COV20_00815 [Candidatus Woesearchaeota archaeon CG10_big_fil_rev_8_21_14_0_10_45_16]